MLELHEDSKYEDMQSCHLFTALEAVMQIQKRKVTVGPNDAVGIMLFNTVMAVVIKLKEISTHSNAFGSDHRREEMRPMAQVRKSRVETLCTSPSVPSMLKMCRNSCAY